MIKEYLYKSLQCNVSQKSISLSHKIKISKRFASSDSMTLLPLLVLSRNNC